MEPSIRVVYSATKRHLVYGNPSDHRYSSNLLTMCAFLAQDDSAAAQERLQSLAISVRQLALAALPMKQRASLGIQCSLPDASAGPAPSLQNPTRKAVTRRQKQSHTAHCSHENESTAAKGQGAESSE